MRQGRLWCWLVMALKLTSSHICSQHLWWDCLLSGRFSWSLSEEQLFLFSKQKYCVCLCSCGLSWRNYWILGSFLGRSNRLVYLLGEASIQTWFLATWVVTLCFIYEPHKTCYLWFCICWSWYWLQFSQVSISFIWVVSYQHKNLQEHSCVK